MTEHCLAKLTPMMQYEISYVLWDLQIVYQPILKNIAYGKSMSKYYGTHIWNLLLNYFKNITNRSYFKDLIKIWEGSQCQCLLSGAIN